MWLRRFTDPAGAGARVPAALAAGMLLVLAACSSTPPASPAAGTPGTAAGAAAGALPPDGRAQFDQAVNAMAGGDLVDAELRFEAFVLQYPAVAPAWVNLAIIQQQNGNPAEARLAIDEALAASPEFAPALNQLGVLLRKNGDFPGAEAAYLKAVTVSPEYALAHYNLGVLNELYLKRLDVALQHFERYRELAGDDEQVDKWIADLTRRVASDQRSANVAE